MKTRTRSRARRAFLLFLLSTPLGASAQGTLQDYQRAQQFLPGNLRHIAYIADVGPHWIENTSRFWYRRFTPSGSDFKYVDQDKAIHFESDDKEWTCSLDSYDCQSKPIGPRHPYESLSPNKRW